jgi:hypothetical protein
MIFLTVSRNYTTKDLAIHILEKLNLPASRSRKLRAVPVGQEIGSGSRDNTAGECIRRAG